VIRAALLSSVFVFALAACGGGTSSAGKLTKAQYDKKLSHMCLLAADQIRELHMDNSIGDWKAFGPDLTAIARRFTNHLDPERAPATIAAAAREYEKANERVVQVERAVTTAATAGDRAKFRAMVKQVNGVNLATFPGANAIGATGCYIP